MKLIDIVGCVNGSCFCCVK